MASREAEWQHCTGDRGIPPGPVRGESFRATLEYLLECIPQVLICVLPERVQILPHGAREENRVLWIDGYRKRRPWPVKIMTRGRMYKRVKTGLIGDSQAMLEGKMFTMGLASLMSF